MPITPVPFPLTALPADELLADLLAVSMTGVIYYTPRYDPAGTGEIVDFTFEYLNPAAQRMMRMPEVPIVTHNEQWPHSIAHGTFQFHVEAYESGEPREYNINYQADGYDNYYRLAARRSGDGLWVSFTDTADQPRSPVEVALREAQAAEKVARADAEEQRAALHRAFEQAPVSIAILRGPEFVVELANPSLGGLWGRPVGPALGRPLFEALPDLAEQGLEELLTQSLRTGEPVIFQERPTLLARNPACPPELGYYNFTYQPLHDAQGQVTGIITVGLDVTEQVLARQQVQQLNQELETRVEERTHEAQALQADLLATARQQAEQQARLYQLFEQTPAPIALLRAPGHRYEYVNPAYQALFPGRPLVGLDSAVAVPELQAQGFLTELDRVYQTGETFRGEELPFALASDAGQLPRLRYFTFTYQPYREAGEIAGVTVFAFDVTEQVLARQEREAERQQLHALFMDAPAPIVILNGSNLVFQLVNPAYQRILPGRALLGRPLLEALPEIVGTTIDECLQRVYDTGETHVAQEQPLSLARQDDGPLEEMFFTFTYQARRNPRGDIDGVLVFAHEVTDQVQARRVVEEGGQQARALAAELAQSNQQLIRTNVDLDNFIYTASHDLKVPIANIEGLLQALTRELPPPALVGDVPEMLELMQLATERFRRTIEQLTDVRQLQQAHDLPAAPVPLAAVVEDVRLDLLPLMQQTQALLHVEVPATIYLAFSEKNLRSVVYNLLGNALKYRHPDRAPDVQLSYFQQEQYQALRVQDNGLGLDLSAGTDKLFGLFQRLHTHVEGSGIGLYMVKKMVENSGGRVEVTSQLGQGSTFTVFFPVHPAA